MDEVELYKITGCQAPCSRWEYASTVVMKKDIPVLDTLIPARGTNTIFKLDIFYANGNYQEKHQYYTYGLNDLLSDFGGFLGLFFDGISACYVHKPCC